jgi:hypothetical protein
VQVVRLDAFSGKRDVRIDWLRGLAMTCVIINHTRRSSLLSWVSYERFWVVTAAEVFVVLSGVVLGMVYGRRLARDGWSAVTRGIGRRVALLYVTFVGVTVSVVALAKIGVNVTSLTASDGHAPAWFLTPQTMTLAAWRDVLLMRAGPWAFEIIGLYVWLVAATIPCLLILQRLGWRALLAASWAVYMWYRLEPHALTTGGFESAFPILAWQLIFVHGLTIGYHRHDINAFLDRLPSHALRGALIVTATFTIFAFGNPWTDGPSWLRLPLVSPEQFAYMYGHYFGLIDLQVGRLLNLAIALPIGYWMLARVWTLMRPLENVFVTLGRRSLGAFVLHVYGLLLLEHLPLPDGLVSNTLVQVALVLAIAVLLFSPQLMKQRRPAPTPIRSEPLAA